MAKKTYGIYGLMEWRGNFRLGNSTVVIDFSGGAFTGLGHSPATFTTADAALQHIIESSTHFRSGKVKRITTLRDIVAEEVPEQKQAPVCYSASDPQDAADWLETHAGISTGSITSPRALIDLAKSHSIKLTIARTSAAKANNSEK